MRKMQAVTLGQRQKIMPSDPAREILDICLTVISSTQETGEAILARHTGTEPSSAQFLVTVGAINHRIERLILICEECDIDRDDKFEVMQYLTLLQQLFLPGTLRNPWHAADVTRVRTSSTIALKLLSAHIRIAYRRPKPSEANMVEAFQALDRFRQHLEGCELGEMEFLRHAALASAEQTHDRLSRLFWLGWENSLRPLREFVAAQFALERLAALYPDHILLDQVATWGIDTIENVAQQLGLAALTGCPGSLLDIYRITSEIVDGMPLTTYAPLTPATKRVTSHMLYQDNGR
jgi:hypothetical protein